MKQRFRIKSIFCYLIFCCGLLCLTTSSADTFEVKHKVFYTDVGSGSPLVLIHPFPMDQRFFKPQQDELKKYFRVISIDLWGFGRSAAVHGQGISMHEYANEVNQLFEHLHLKNALVAGESMGGYVALAFYKYYPEKVAGLILSGTNSTADNEVKKRKRQTDAESVMKHGSVQLIDGLLPKLLSAHASKNMQDELKQIMQSQSPAGLSSALIGIGQREDTSYLLSNARIPILIISGDQDAIISPDHSEAMHRLAKGSKFVMIKNTGHLSSFEQPKQWNQAVIEAFKMTTPETSTN